ncbi:RNA polymerase sigma factor [Chthonobacter albigriseus]|uniref:RNA polymerase sigma factor n=1 Tax=Chthonobacter albigriseus TaxID=1683161 RepID=UPI0015EFAFDE|nr:DUF6596 domain-containing protein [Chthonobacter albigriseus]
MSGSPSSAAARAAERAARLSYGKLLAWLAREWRDMSAAEDALADAFRKALETWPASGIPEKPDAWLRVAARHRLADSARSAKVRGDAGSTLAILAEQEATEAAIPDRRLALMFVCAHPAVPEKTQTPLMLQTVLGLDAARIASAFLIQPAAMGQRLSRAKAEIRDRGLRFEEPGPDEIAARGERVREAIYAAYGAGWDGIAGTDTRRKGLMEEAIWLARVLLEVSPTDPEVRGLLALMLHCEARNAARRTPDGAYVPLADQDTTLWNRDLVFEAERELMTAARAGRPGRFQIEAAIQSAAVYARLSGRNAGAAVLQLYDHLLAFAPTIGNHLGRIAVLADVAGAETALDALSDLPQERVRDHQPFHALRGDLLARLDRRDEAAVELRHAAGLSEDPGVRAFLLARAGG